MSKLVDLWVYHGCTCHTREMMTGIISIRIPDRLVLIPPHSISSFWHGCFHFPSMSSNAIVNLDNCKPSYVNRTTWHISVLGFLRLCDQFEMYPFCYSLPICAGKPLLCSHTHDSSCIHSSPSALCGYLNLEHIGRPIACLFSVSMYSFPSLIW